MLSTYQVGEIDENGFVCIGIEERKVHRKQKTGNKNIFGDVNSFNSDNGSDDSSCDEYSSGYNSYGASSSRES